MAGMKYRVAAAPTVEPVSLEELKAQLGVTLDLDDALLGRKLRAARQHVEQFIGGPLIATVYEGVLDAFPPAEIEIPVTPVLAVERVGYADAQGALQVVPADRYEVDAFGDKGWIVPHQGFAWPATMATVNAVRVRWTAGFGTGPQDVPATLGEAILQLAAWWGEQREAALVEGGAREIPFGVAELLRGHRGWTFG